MRAAPNASRNMRSTEACSCLGICKERWAGVGVTCVGGATLVPFALVPLALVPFALVRVRVSVWAPRQRARKWDEPRSSSSQA